MLLDPGEMVVDRLLLQVRADEVDRAPVDPPPIRDRDQRHAVVVQQRLQLRLPVSPRLERLAVQLQPRKAEVADQLDLLLVDWHEHAEEGRADREVGPTIRDGYLRHVILTQWAEMSGVLLPGRIARLFGWLNAVHSAPMSTVSQTASQVGGR
jgi:hypothetical protein